MVRMILFCCLFVLQNDKIFPQDYSKIWEEKKSSITKEFFNNNLSGESFNYTWENQKTVVTARTNKIIKAFNKLTFTFGTNVVEYDAKGEEIDLNYGARRPYGSGEHHSANFTYKISGQNIILDYTRLEYAGGGERYDQIKTFSINEILDILEINRSELQNFISKERIKFIRENNLLYLNRKFAKMNNNHSFWDLIEGGRKDLAVALKIPNNDLTYLNENGETPLHYGAKLNELSLVKKLITKGVDIDVRDFDGNTPLSLALKNNANEELIFLLTNKSNERCSYALFSYSIRNSNINLINRCIDEKVPYDIYDDNIDYKTFKYEVFEILNSSASIRISLNRIIENHFSSILNNEDNYLFINKSLSGDMPYIPTSSELESLMNKNDIFTLYVKNKTFKKLFLLDDKYELYDEQNDVRLNLLNIKPLNRSIEYIDQLVGPESENFDYIIDKMILNTIFTNKKKLTTHLINKKFENTKNPSMLNDYNYNNILYECLDRNFITNSKLLIQNYNFDDTVWKLARANQNAKVINRLNKIFKTFPNKKNLMTTDDGVYKEEFQPEYALNSFEGWRQYGYDKKNKLAYKKSRLKIERDIETAERHRIALEAMEKQNQMKEEAERKRLRVDKLNSISLYIIGRSVDQKGVEISYNGSEYMGDDYELILESDAFIGMGMYGIGLSKIKYNKITDINISYFYDESKTPTEFVRFGMNISMGYDLSMGYLPIRPFIGLGAQYHLYRLHDGNYYRDADFNSDESILGLYYFCELVKRNDSRIYFGLSICKGFDSVQKQESFSIKIGLNF